MATAPTFSPASIPLTFDIQSLLASTAIAYDSPLEMPAKAIVIWNPVTDRHEISARMAGYRISADIQAMAKELARLELYNAADAAIACDNLHFEVKSCANGCEAYVVPSRCHHNFCTLCGKPTERMRQLLKRLRTLKKQFSHSRDCYFYRLTIDHGSPPQTYSECRARQLAAHRLVYLLFPQRRGEERTDYTRWDADHIDPSSPLATILVLYQPKHSWQRVGFRELERHWKALGGDSVTCEHALTGDCERIDELTIKLLSGMAPVLRMPGVERARMQKAFYRYHSIRAHGVEPLDMEGRMEIEDLGQCGHCCRPLERGTVKEGQTLTELHARFRRIRMGTGSGTRRLIYIADWEALVDKSAYRYPRGSPPPS